ncbi:MAG: hypothetical protein ACREA2_02730 [Blastocatellia bacterium]
MMQTLWQDLRYGARMLWKARGFTLIAALTLFVVFIVCLFDPVRSDQNLAGVWEGELQDPRRPVVTTVDFAALRVSFSGGAAISMTPPALSADGRGVTFDVANGAQTLKFAGARDGTRISGTLDTSSRRLPFWLERLPAVSPPVDRGEAWRQDIDAVLSRFLRYDRSFGELQREAARARLQKLRANAGHLTDAAIMVELARAVALGANAHTRLYLMRNRTEVRRVPLRFWWFRDELRIVRAAAEHEQLLGCRVTGVGSLSATKALQRMSDIKAGNASWQRYMSVYFLTSPDLLFGAGVIASPERLPLTVVCGDTRRRIEVAPLPLRRSSTPVEAWWDLAPGYPHTDAGFKAALRLEKPPLYLQHPERAYWVEYLPEPAIIYLQYNRAQGMAAEPMADFIRRVTRLVDEHSIKGLMIDVRFNTGGDAGVGTPLVETLAARLKGAPVAVLTSRATFSAGITHAAQWKQFANAAIVGAPVGDHLDSWSEGGNLLLPNSKLTVHYANGFHAYSQRDYPAFKPYFADLNVAALSPDVMVEMAWADYVAGRDPLFDAALARLRKTK